MSQKINYDELSSLQIDALKEVGNIGAAHAATALSQIIEKTIMISVSKFEILPLEQVYKTIGPDTEEIVAVNIKLLGNVLGGIILVFSLENALKLANMISHSQSAQLDEMNRLALKEAGSIITAAYLAAIGKFTKLSLIPSIPHIEQGVNRQTLQLMFSEITKRSDVAFCIENAFTESSINMKGYFLLVPQANSLEIILKNLGIDQY